MRLNKVAGLAASTFFSGALVLGLSTTATAAPDLGSLGSTGAAEAPVVKPGGECAANYLKNKDGDAGLDKWEINWGMQTTDTGTLWNNKSFGELTFIEPGTLKSAEQELAAINAAVADGSTYHWWYTSRNMVNKGAKMTMKFGDGDQVVGQVAVGTDNCPSVKWTHTNKDGKVVDTIKPETFPAEPVDLFGSLTNFFGNLS